MKTKLPRIASIEVIAPYAVKVTWKSGGTDIVDMTGVVYDFAPFEPLRDPETFAGLVKLKWGQGIEWPEQGLDFSADSLHAVAIEQTTFDRDDFIAWQGALGLSNQEAADVLGINLATVKNYRSGATPVPKATGIACRSMQDNRIVFAAHYKPRKAGRPRKGEKKVKIGLENDTTSKVKGRVAGSVLRSVATITPTNKKSSTTHSVVRDSKTGHIHDPTRTYRRRAIDLD